MKALLYAPCATLASRKPSRAKLPKHLPRVYCGHCKRLCKATCVAVNGPMKAERSRVVFTCERGRCRLNGMIAHRTTSFHNGTGY